MADLELAYLDEILKDFRALTYPTSSNVIHPNVGSIFVDGMKSSDCTINHAFTRASVETDSEDSIEIQFLAYTKQAIDLNNQSEADLVIRSIIKVAQVWREYVLQKNHPLYSISVPGFSMERMRLDNMRRNTVEDISTGASETLIMEFSVLGDYVVE